MSVKLKQLKTRSIDVELSAEDDQGNPGKIKLKYVFSVPSQKTLNRIRKWVLNALLQLQHASDATLKGVSTQDQLIHALNEGVNKSESRDEILKEVDEFDKTVREHFLGIRGIQDDDGAELSLADSKLLVYNDDADLILPFLVPPVQTAFYELIRDLSAGKSLSGLGTKSNAQAASANPSAASPTTLPDSSDSQTSHPNSSSV